MEKKPKNPEDNIEVSSTEEQIESEDIYDDESRQEMLEDDEITETEEEFMRGWDGTVEGGKKHKMDNEHQDMASVELVKEQYRED